MIGRYHRIKLVIFDLDQTLLCTIRRFYEALNEALRIHGEQQLSWNEFVELYSHDMLRVRYTDDRLWHYFLTIYTKRRTSHDGPLEGAKEILEWLKKNNIKVAIVTGRIAEVSDVIRELEDYGLAD
ncbi:MAG: HAD family hydrolase, partial [Thermoprotei archaeon]